MGILNSCVV